MVADAFCSVHIAGKDPPSDARSLGQVPSNFAEHYLEKPLPGRRTFGTARSEEAGGVVVDRAVLSARRSGDVIASGDGRSRSGKPRLDVRRPGTRR